MKILAVDAATEACSAALWIDGRVTEHFEVIGRGHADRLLPLVDEVLTAAGLRPRELDGVAFGRGPGGFTGLRIAAAVAQGLAAGAGKPVVPVSNLAALAVGAVIHGEPPRVLACLDARMGEVYWAGFDCSGELPRLLGREQLTAPAAVELPAGGTWKGAGHGFAAWPEIAERLGLVSVDAISLPRAAEIANIGAKVLASGGGVAPAEGLPVYLRDDVVHRR
jgi:tRNA threonylcarbamoyladenosine biosynthesis protein TsaB